MTEYHSTHATFELERVYHTALSRVFAAWAEPSAKAGWFVESGFDHQLDFRVGGRETLRGRPGEGPLLTFESTYQDIVADERIVYTSTLSVDGRVATVSITTIEFTATGNDTRLLLTEQGTFLDELEQPSWRQEGTSQQLAALATALADEAPAGRVG